MFRHLGHWEARPLPYFEQKDSTIAGEAEYLHYTFRFAYHNRVNLEIRCLWGGVKGFVTVETGTQGDVREAVRQAISVLAAGGGFILSPVDNVTKNASAVWANIRAMIETWQDHRAYLVRC